jgi:phage terminase large subunit-like protein
MALAFFSGIGNRYAPWENAMTDFAPIRSSRPRSMSRLQALVLALVLILGGVAIARADRPADAGVSLADLPIELQ